LTASNINDPNHIDPRCVERECKRYLLIVSIEPARSSRRLPPARGNVKDYAGDELRAFVADVEDLVKRVGNVSDADVTRRAPSRGRH